MTDRLIRHESRFQVDETMDNLAAAVAERGLAVRPAPRSLSQALTMVSTSSPWGVFSRDFVADTFGAATASLVASILLARAAALGLVLAAASTPSTWAAEMRMTEVTRLESAYTFANTVQKLRSVLEAKGFTIFAVIDQREAAKSVGLDMPLTTLLIYGNPRGGTPLMLAAPDFGIELPLKVLIREDTGGKVIVAYTPATSLEGRHGLPAGLATKLASAEPLIAAAVGAKSN